MNKSVIIGVSAAILLGGAVTFLATNKSGVSRPVSTVKSNQTADEAMKQKENEAMAMKKAKAEEEARTAKGEDAAMKKSSGYISYADYQAKKDSYKGAKVVLFFHAPWCPTCQALDRDVTSNVGNLPAGTVIVKTDYDSSTDLKKKYGVTYQHTLVQIDDNGDKIKKWSGSTQLSSILSEIQA